VIQYVKERYGIANVPRSARSHAGCPGGHPRRGRALGLPIPRVDGIVALVPEELHITIPHALEKSEDLKKVYDTTAKSASFWTWPSASRGWHATWAPMRRRSSSPTGRWSTTFLAARAGEEEVITQWAMADVEKAGLLKMDFLACAT